MKRKIAVGLSILLGSSSPLSIYGNSLAISKNSLNNLGERSISSIDNSKLTLQDLEDELLDLVELRNELLGSKVTDKNLEQVNLRIDMLKDEIDYIRNKSLKSDGFVIPNAGEHKPDEFSADIQSKITTFINQEGTWYYYVDNNGDAILVDYVGMAEEITIPQIVNGIKVVEILGFSENSSVYDITETHGLLNTNTTVKTINITHDIRLGKGALKTIKSNSIKTQLETINGAEYIKYIGDNAFTYLDTLVNFDLNKVLDNVTSIGEWAFAYCNSLDVYIDLKDNITSIGSYAFYFCNKLRGKADLSNIINLNEYIFYNSSINEVVFSSTCTVLPDYILSNCKELIKVTGLNNLHTVGWNSLFNACNLEMLDIEMSKLVSIGASAFKKCGAIQGNIDISNASNLGNLAFAGTKITNVILSPQLTKINSYVFEGCTNLISLPDLSNIVELSIGVFKDCKGLLGDIDISHINKLGAKLFYGCSNIEAVKISDNITSLPSSLFKGCSNLREVTGLINVTNFDNVGETFSDCFKLNSWDLNDFKVTNWSYFGLNCLGKELLGTDTKLGINVNGLLGSYAFGGAKLGTIILGNINLEKYNNSNRKYTNQLSETTIDKLVVTKQAVQQSPELFIDGFECTRINELVLEDGVVLDNMFNNVGIEVKKITFEGEATITNSFRHLENSTVELRGTNNKLVKIMDSLICVGILDSNLIIDCMDTTGGRYSDFKFDITTKGKVDVNMSVFSDGMDIRINNESVIGCINNTSDFGLVKSKYLDGSSNIKVNVENGELLFGLEGSILREVTAKEGKWYKKYGNDIIGGSDYLYNLLIDSVVTLLPYYTMPVKDNFVYSVNGVDNAGLSNIIDFDIAIINFDVTSFDINQPSKINTGMDIQVTSKVYGAFTDKVKIVIKDDKGIKVGELNKAFDNNFEGVINLDDITSSLTYELINKGNNAVLLSKTISVKVIKSLNIRPNKTITKGYDGNNIAYVTLDDLDVVGDLPIGKTKEELIEIVSATYDTSDFGDSKVITVILQSKLKDYAIPTTIEMEGSITQSNTEIGSNDVQYNDNITFGDNLEIRVKPRIINRSILGSVELYKDTTLIASTTTKDGDYFVLNYDSSDRKLGIGSNDLYIRYVGNNNTLGSIFKINVNLSPKEVSATYNLDYSYDGLNEKDVILNLQGVLNNNVTNLKAKLLLDENTINVGDTVVVNNIDYNLGDEYYILPLNNIIGTINISKADIVGSNTFEQDFSVKNKNADTYELPINLESIFRGKSFGNVTYSALAYSEVGSSNLGYLDGAVKLEGNNLVFNINNIDTLVEEHILSVDLIIHTTNFNDVIYRLNVYSSNKDKPILNVINMECDYGIDINENSIKYNVVDTKGNEVLGKINVIGGGVLAVGDHSLNVVFTPNDIDRYDVVKTSLNVRVNKSKLTLVKPPLLSEVYKVNNILSDFTFTTNGTFVDNKGNIVTDYILEWVTPSQAVDINTKYEFILKSDKYEFVGELIPYTTDKLPKKTLSGDTIVFTDGSLLVGKSDIEIDSDGTINLNSDAIITRPNGDIIKIKSNIVEFPNGTIVTLPSGEVVKFDKDITLILADGSKYPTNGCIAELPNGGVVLNDGTIKPNFPVIRVNTNGDLILPDGTVLGGYTSYYKTNNGDIVVEIPIGLMDKFPNGCLVFLKLDGTIIYKAINRVEIKLPNGGVTNNGVVVDTNDTVVSNGKPVIDGNGSVTLSNGGYILKPNGSIITLSSGIFIIPNKPSIIDSSNGSDSNNWVIGNTGVIINDTNMYKVINSTKDETNKNWYGDILEKLKQKGIISDKDLNNLHGNISRCDFADYIIRLLDKEYGINLDISSNKFKDIDLGLTTHVALMELNSEGIFLGYGNGEMKPDQTITREEMAVVVSKLANYLGIDKVVNNDSFVGIEKASFWSKEHIESLTGYGILIGNNNMFEPKKHFTKVESFSIIYNIIKVKQ